MEINFETKDLRELCDDESIAAERLGVDAADYLRRRLADIRAADSIDDLIAGDPRKGTFGNRDCVRLDLASAFELIVVPNHVPPRNDADGTTAWNRVRRVRVVALEPK